jgi:hypothetical protein
LKDTTNKLHVHFRRPVESRLQTVIQLYKYILLVRFAERACLMIDLNLRCHFRRQHRMFNLLRHIHISKDIAVWTYVLL